METVGYWQHEGARDGMPATERSPADRPPELPAPEPKGADIRQRFVIRLVAFATQIPPAQLLSASRGTADISRSRQIAMYLLHTKLSIPLAEVGKCFRRDRTTVAHACAAIEDLRDIPERDDFIGELESMLDLALSMAPGDAGLTKLPEAAE